jgi:hypothetical protein
MGAETANVRSYRHWKGGTSPQSAYFAGNRAASAAHCRVAP